MCEKKKNKKRFRKIGYLSLTKPRIFGLEGNKKTHWVGVCKMSREREPQQQAIEDVTSRGRGRKEAQMDTTE